MKDGSKIHPWQCTSTGIYLLQVTLGEDSIICFYFIVVSFVVLDLHHKIHFHHQNQPSTRVNDTYGFYLHKRKEVLTILTLLGWASRQFGGQGIGTRLDGFQPRYCLEAQGSMSPKSKAIKKSDETSDQWFHGLQNREDLNQVAFSMDLLQYLVQ